MVGKYIRQSIEPTITLIDIYTKPLSDINVQIMYGVWINYWIRYAWFFCKYFCETCIVAPTFIAVKQHMFNNNCIVIKYYAVGAYCTRCIVC